MLNKIEIDKIIQVIIDNYQPDAIYLYGSYLNNSANQDSDLDLAVIKRTTASFYERTREIRRLFKNNPVPMDLVVYTPEEFELRVDHINMLPRIILKEGKKVYERAL
jgi:uncharacterized protein